MRQLFIFFIFLTGSFWKLVFIVVRKFDKQVCSSKSFFGKIQALAHIVGTERTAPKNSSTVNVKQKTVYDVYIADGRL